MWRVVIFNLGTSQTSSQGQPDHHSQDKNATQHSRSRLNPNHVLGDSP